MAVLRKLPSKAVIDMLAGTLDFYVYHPVSCQGQGIPCVRKWPTYYEERMTEASKAMRPVFGYVNQMWRELSPEVRAAWERMASMTGPTAKDLSIRGYINGELI